MTNIQLDYQVDEEIIVDTAEGDRVEMQRGGIENVDADTVAGGADKGIAVPVNGGHVPAKVVLTGGGGKTIDTPEGLVEGSSKDVCSESEMGTDSDEILSLEPAKQAGTHEGDKDEESQQMVVFEEMVQVEPLN